MKLDKATGIIPICAETMSNPSFMEANTTSDWPFPSSWLGTHTFPLMWISICLYRLISLELHTTNSCRLSDWQQHTSAVSLGTYCNKSQCRVYDISPKVQLSRMVSRPTPAGVNASSLHSHSTMNSGFGHKNMASGALQLKLVICYLQLNSSTVRSHHFGWRIEQSAEGSLGHSVLWSWALIWD